LQQLRNRAALQPVRKLTRVTRESGGRGLDQPSCRRYGRNGARRWLRPTRTRVRRSHHELRRYQAGQATESEASLSGTSYPQFKPKPPRITRRFPYRDGPKTVGSKRFPLSRGALVMRRSGVQIPEAALGRNLLRCNSLRRCGTLAKGFDSSGSEPQVPRKCPGPREHSLDPRTGCVGRA